VSARAFPDDDALQVSGHLTGCARVIVEHVEPEIDGGRFPIKRSIGEWVDVTADLLADGHDRLAGVLKYRRARDRAGTVARPDAGGGEQDIDRSAEWDEVPLVDLGNDRWSAAFQVTTLGEYEYTVEGWIDVFSTWLTGTVAKADAGQDVSSELIEGAAIIEAAAERGQQRRAADAARNGDAASDPDPDLDPGRQHLLQFATTLRGNAPQLIRVGAARSTTLAALMAERPERRGAAEYPRVLAVRVDAVRATFGAWYEMFPRSFTPDPSRSGTFAEAEARLPDLAALGFDVVYLPPIHPIGRTHRKGRNNSLTAAPEDPGSPWAIGSAEGGHTAVEPGLGTIDDFDRFTRVANRLGLDVALDIAFQASPDHPWVREHPEWFRHRPDGTIKYAENPPKKYQDIYPLDFESADSRGLWLALRDVFLFWAAHGVTLFRVDNPHTKNFRFWEWVIGEVQRVHPEAIFLAEAFTRPKLMRYLAKAGFSQSYTYFTWRNTTAELREYLTELTNSELREYMRPNFFVNTPDILSEFLQTGGRPAFELRLILAATLAASYGMYSGYELLENQPVRPGSEEYLDSEKYQFRPRDFGQAGPMRELIARVNEIRRAHRALQQNATLAFHETDNGALLFYSKRAARSPAPRSNDSTHDRTRPASSGAGAAEARSQRETDAPPDRVFVVANNDVHSMQEGWVQVPIWELGIRPGAPYMVEDLLDGARYTWHGEWNYVRLDPDERVAHVFVVLR
jgi:starch synthase (maltosyl-transferring)